MRSALFTAILLAITFLGPTPITAGTRAPRNFDESKVGTYTLPDPLLSSNGRKVITTAQWTEDRRPELLRLFETHVYGKVPKPGQSD